MQNDKAHTSNTWSMQLFNFPKNKTKKNYPLNLQYDRSSVFKRESQAEAATGEARPHVKAWLSLA